VASLAFYDHSYEYLNNLKQINEELLQRSAKGSDNCSLLRFISFISFSLFVRIGDINISRMLRSTFRSHSGHKLLWGNGERTTVDFTLIYVLLTLVFFAISKHTNNVEM